MAYERSKTIHDNFGEPIYQFQPKTKTLIRKHGKILIKTHFNLIILLFYLTYLNERLLPNYTHTHVCVCVCVCVEHQNDKQKLQILEALHIRNMQLTLNRINFQTSANVLKCL